MKIGAKAKLLIDITIFMTFLVSMRPELTGISVHEWLTTAMIGGFVTHLLAQWDWLVNVARRLLARWDRSRLNFTLDVSLWLAMTTVFVSGYAISRSVLPFLGIPIEHDFVWRRIHDASANFTLVIVAIHVALHWRWILNAFQRLFSRRRAAQVAPRQQEVSL